jgi:hypothetical protein
VDEKADPSGSAHTHRWRRRLTGCWTKKRTGQAAPTRIDGGEVSPAVGRKSGPVRQHPHPSIEKKTHPLLEEKADPSGSTHTHRSRRRLTRCWKKKADLSGGTHTSIEEKTDSLLEKYQNSQAAHTRFLAQLRRTYI